MRIDQSPREQETYPWYSSEPVEIVDSTLTYTFDLAWSTLTYTFDLACSTLTYTFDLACTILCTRIGTHDKLTTFALLFKIIFKKRVVTSFKPHAT